MTQSIRTIRILSQGPAGSPGLFPRPAWSEAEAPYVRGTALAHAGIVWLALRDTSAEPSNGVPDDWSPWIDLGEMLGGVATLDENGKIEATQLPAIAITDTHAVASQAAMLALTAQKGDIAVRSDINRSYVLATDSPATLADWKELLTPTDAVLSVAGRTGVVSLSQADIAGLTTTSAPQFAGATLAGGAVTTNAPVLAVSQTWNDAGATFVGHTLDVTDNGSAAGSSLARWRIGGSERFSVSKFGQVNATQGYNIEHQGRGVWSSVTLTLDRDTTLGWASALATAYAGPDTVLRRDAPDTLAQRRGSQAQTFRLYNSHVDASNYERAAFSWESNTLVLRTQAAGSGSNRGITIAPGDGTLAVSGAVVASGSVDAGATAHLGWSARAILKSPADGSIVARNRADSAYAFLQGKLRTDAGAVTETITPDKTLTLYDAAGNAYKVPCVAA